MSLSEEQDTIQTRHKSKIKYCKYCGSELDGVSKKCTSCGKQYFRGFRFNKYTITIFVLVLFIIGLLILNITQYNKNQNKISNLNSEISKLENELERIKEYAPNYYIDENGEVIHVH